MLRLTVGLIVNDEHLNLMIFTFSKRQLGKLATSARMVTKVSFKI